MPLLRQVALHVAAASSAVAVHVVRPSRCSQPLPAAAGLIRLRLATLTPFLGAARARSRSKALLLTLWVMGGSLAPSHAEWDESSVEGPSPSETGEEERQTVERPEKDHRAQGGSSALARIASAHIASAHSQTSSLPASTSSHSTTPASSICAPRTPRSSPPPTPTHPLTKMCRIP